MSKNIVHVIGTGTIGEPLIGALSLHREEFGIDEVTFHKNRVLINDKPRLLQMMKRGAMLVSNQDCIKDFRAQGLEVSFEREEAIKRATVVIDCTPSGTGISNKNVFYKKYADHVRGFIAQGSEFGFGKMYAQGINDSSLNRNEDQFIHIVSCNTHNIASIIKILGSDDKGNIVINKGQFLCLRRANDISQESHYIPAPKVSKHSNKKFGTHHARDAFHLFQTLGYELNLFSSAVKLNTQYMHTLHFNLSLPHKISLDEIIYRLEQNKCIALTNKTSSNSIFSFGREHGHYGRILSHAVVSVPTLTLSENNDLVGFCFTPQDGNSLLSSIAATLWYLDPDSVDERIDCLRSYLFQEV